MSATLWTETCPVCRGAGEGAPDDLGNPTPCLTCGGLLRQVIHDPVHAWGVLKPVNLTQHDVVLLDVDDAVMLTIPPSGVVARCETTRTTIGHLSLQGADGCYTPINRTQFGVVTDLPAPQHYTIYIVSRIVAEACPERRDLYIPDDTVRDNDGRIIGARALAQV